MPASTPLMKSGMDSKSQVQEKISNPPNSQFYGVLFLDWDDTVVFQIEKKTYFFNAILETLRIAKALNFDIRIVTARPLSKEIKHYLKAWDQAISWDTRVHCVYELKEFLGFDNYDLKELTPARKKHCIKKVIKDNYPHLANAKKNRCLFVDDKIDNVREVVKIIPVAQAYKNGSHFPTILNFLSEKKQEKQAAQNLFVHLKNCLDLLSPNKYILKSVPEGIKEIQKKLTCENPILDDICEIARGRKKKTYLESSICPLFCRRDPLVSELYQILSEADASLKKLNEAISKLEKFAKKIETTKQNIKPLHKEKDFVRDPIFLKLGF